MHMPRLSILLAVLALTAFLEGCATYSLHPFYKADENTLEPSLVGTWTVDKTKITIEAKKEGTYEAEGSDMDSHTDFRYKVRLIRVGSNLFADSILEEESINGKNFDLPYGVAPLHFLYKVSLNGDTLRLSLLSHEWLAKQFEAKKISIAHEYMDDNADPRDSSILLTASSADLQKFIQQIADTPDAFEDPDIMHRQK
jgi:hypothetical protein